MGAILCKPCQLSTACLDYLDPSSLNLLYRAGIGCQSCSSIHLALLSIERWQCCVKNWDVFAHFSFYMTDVILFLSQQTSNFEIKVGDLLKIKAVIPCHRRQPLQARPHLLWPRWASILQTPGEAGHFEFPKVERWTSKSVVYFRAFLENLASIIHVAFFHGKPEGMYMK